MKMGKYEQVYFPSAKEITASFPVRALQVGVPDADNMDDFERFIEEMLAPHGVNVLLLCLDYGFEFKTHPEIVDTPFTSHAVARRLAAVCARNSMKVVPVINVLAHQSSIYGGWTNKGMLRAYPDMEEVFEGELHSSKCLCSRHPRVRPIVDDMVAELMDAFETETVHGGFDEVWDIGKCPRCKGVQPYRLFAEYVNDVNAMVTKRGGTMWMWADQLVDGHLVPSQNAGYETCLTGLHQALPLLSRDIVMCDWHYYDEPLGHLAPSYWAMRDFRFIECAFNSLHGIDQLLAATRVVRSPRTLGTMLTTWCRLPRFMQEVNALYPQYLKDGLLVSDKSFEDSGIDNAHRFARQAANSFLKMFVGHEDD